MYIGQDLSSYYQFVLHYVAKTLAEGGHCPGNEGNQEKVRESDKGLK